MLQHNIQYLEQRLEKRGWMIVDKQTLSVIVVLYFDALLLHIIPYYVFFSYYYFYYFSKILNVGSRAV